MRPAFAKTELAILFRSAVGGDDQALSRFEEKLAMHWDTLLEDREGVADQRAPLLELRSPNGNGWVMVLRVEAPTPAVPWASVAGIWEGPDGTFRWAKPAYARLMPPGAQGFPDDGGPCDLLELIFDMRDVIREFNAGRAAS